MKFFGITVILLFSLMIFTSICEGSTKIKPAKPAKATSPKAPTSPKSPRTRKTTTTVDPDSITTTTLSPEEWRELYPTVMSIEKVAAQALETFAKKQPMSSFQENLKELINLASQLTITDVFLTKDRLNQADPNPESVTNPVGYMEIFHDKYVMINVFVFKQFSKIPLHDHPLMHGVLKVISGKVKLTSYSLEDPHFIKERDYNSSSYSPVNYYYINDFVTMYETLGTPAIAHDPVILSENDPATFLTPYERNIHKVEAIDGPAAFIDILAPPYHTTQGALKRKCTYFHVMENARGTPLLCVNYFPAAYYTVDIPYTGPNLNETLSDIKATYHKTRKPRIKD